MAPGTLRRSRQRVIRLPLDHRPHSHAQCGQRPLRILELGEQVGRHAKAALVAGVDLVSPALDDVIGGRAHVGHVRFAQQREHRVDQTAHRVHGATIGAALEGARVERAEQLEGGVDEVDLHGRLMVRTRPVSGW
jgi:hypothetical protein